VLSLGETNNDNNYLGDDLQYVVAKLLELGCGDPMTRDQLGRTALHRLVRSHSKDDLDDCIDALLSFVDESQRTSYVNAVDSEGKSAIFYASVDYFSISRVRKLLELHADPSVGNPTGSSILHNILSLGNPNRRSILHYVSSLGETNDDDDDGVRRIVTKLLELGCGDPMTRDQLGRTALHLLVRNDPKHNLNDCSDALLSFVDESQRMSYVHATDSRGKSAIFYASFHYPTVSRVRKLLELHADPFVGNPTGCSILDRVLSLGANNDDYVHGDDLRYVISKLLELGCGDPMTRDQWGRTALHRLVQNISESDLNDCIDAFISFVDESQQTSYVNAVDSEGKSAIFYASVDYFSSSRVLKLLELHADPSVGNPTGRPILHDVLSHFPSYGDVDYTRAAMKLIELGCDPKAQDERGRTALHILAMRGTTRSFDLFEGLLAYVHESERADFLNTVDADGKSAIYLAVDSSFSLDLVNKLLDFAADPFVGDPTGSVIFHSLLAQMGLFARMDTDDEEESVRAVTKLLDLGCDPKVQNEKGQTALHILTKNSSVHDFNRIISLLFSYVDQPDREFYVNTRDREGKSAVFSLMESGSSPSDTIERVSILVEAGLKINAADNKGRTFLHAAVARESNSHSCEIIAFLLDCGATVNQQDENGQTVLHLVTARALDDKGKKAKIVSLLLQHGARPTMTDNRGNVPLNYLGGHSTYIPTVAFQLFQHMVKEGYQFGG